LPWLNNKIDIKQKSFVKEEDILEIYNLLKFQPKQENKVSQLRPLVKTFETKQAKKKTIHPKSKNSLNDFAKGLEEFTEEMCHKMNKQIIWTVSERISQLEPKLFDWIQQSMKDLGSKLQKSIDMLIQDNIFRLNLTSKRANSTKSSKYIRSGKKKRMKNKSKQVSRASSEIDFKPVKSIDHVRTFYNKDIDKLSKKARLISRIKEQILCIEYKRR
jgi:hypothetical protein